MEPIDPGVTDAECTNFIARLEDRYGQEDLARTHPIEQTRVDPLGYARWTSSYWFKRQRGEDHETATRAVLAEINTIVEKALPVLGPLPGSFPAPPTRDALLGGQITVQGLMVDTRQYGRIPWWPACWAWLSAEDRYNVAKQLRGAGDRILLIQLPDGVPLYNEPAPNFYSPDKFGPLDLTHGNTTIDQMFIGLIEEAIGVLEFDGVWITLGGDDGNKDGYNIAIVQTQMLGPALAASPFGNLNEYVVQIPGWDGVWHKPNPGTGYSREQIAGFSFEARAFGAKHVGIEHGTGYELAGGGRSDYAYPNGVMSHYDLILGEFDDEQFDDNEFQLLARYLGPAYKRDPAQASADDAGAPFGANAPQFALAETTPRGRYWYRVFEYFIYGFVRGATPERVAVSKRRFQAMGADGVC